MITKTTEKNKLDRLMAAKKALEMATAPKKVYSPYTVIELKGDELNICALDKEDNEYEFIVTQKQVLDFVESFYSTTNDSERGGEHIQWEDNTSALIYYIENQQLVLKDFLNNTKNVEQYRIN